MNVRISSLMILTLMVLPFPMGTPVSAAGQDKHPVSIYIYDWWHRRNMKSDGCEQNYDTDPNCGTIWLYAKNKDTGQRFFLSCNYSNDNCRKLSSGDWQARYDGASQMAIRVFRTRADGSQYETEDLYAMSSTGCGDCYVEPEVFKKEP